MEIRIMNIGDYDQVYALWLNCSGMGLNDKDDSREGISRYLARNPETSFVAIENDRVVGVIMTGHDGRRGYIHHTAVHPDCRRQGVGRQLVEVALEALKACGINKAALVAFSWNEAGNRFWAEMGFEEREDLTYRNRTLVEMQRIDT